MSFPCSRLHEVHAGKGWENTLTLTANKHPLQAFKKKNTTHFKSSMALVKQSFPWLLCYNTGCMMFVSDGQWQRNLYHNILQSLTALKLLQQ